MSRERSFQRCDGCGELYEPRLGRDGLCFACATHFGCACADEPEKAKGHMKIHETTTSDGLLSPVLLELVDGTLHVSSDGKRMALPATAIEAVMRRYGGPIDPAEHLTLVESLSLSPESHLRHVRHLSGYDVIARDYLVYEHSDNEPLCALAVTVAGALVHLARAAANHD